MADQVGLITMWRPGTHASLCEPETFFQSIYSRTPLQEPSMFSKQTTQPVQESRQTQSRELDTGIAFDSCFLLCNCTQLLFLREGILVL